MEFYFSEKEVAFNLFNAIKGGMTQRAPASNKTSRLRARSATPSCGAKKASMGPTKAFYRMPTAGIRTSGPSATDLHPQENDMYLQVTAKSMAR